MKTLKISLTVLVALFVAFNTLSAYAMQEQPSIEKVATISGKININTADVHLLAATLKGVGHGKAQAIVDYRKDFGPFHDLQELQAVKGIGSSIIEKNAHLIDVN